MKWIDSNGIERVDLPWAEGHPNSTLHCVVVDLASD